MWIVWITFEFPDGAKLVNILWITFSFNGWCAVSITPHCAANFNAKKNLRQKNHRDATTKTRYFLLFSLYFLYTFIQLHTTKGDSDNENDNESDNGSGSESESENVIVSESVGAVDSVDSVDNF